MTSDLVSVIVPVYNCEKEIRKCVESILSSDYKNLEIILINDGSKDRSGDICQQLSDMYSQIRYYSQNNSGVSVARNLGIEKAMGQYIMFVDGDDQISPELISALLRNMNPDTDIVCCSYSILDENRIELMFEKEIAASSDIEKEPFFIQLMDRTYGNSGNNATAIGVPWGKIFRKDLIDNNKIRFNPALRRMQDNIFVMHAIYYAKAVKYIPLGLYYYRVDHINSYKNGAYSHDVYKGVLRERLVFFKEHKEFFTSKMKDYLYKENLSYLMMSIHYIVAHDGSQTAKISSIKDICNEKVHDILKKLPPKICPKKQLLQWLMLKQRMYTALYWSYKIKYKL